VSASANPSPRLLSIGEFAAATQLSPKALRLYDEQRLLQPARVDSASGYRYYGNDQVAVGRLIRTLRDMDLSLADVARVVSAEGARAEQLLSQLATELDRRYSREKHAFQRALLLLRDARPSESLTVEQRKQPAMTVLVRPFVTDRRRFFERLQCQVDAAGNAAARAGLRVLAEWYCKLIDPLSEEEGQVELLLRIEPPAGFPEDVTLRQLPPAACAAVSVNALNVQGADFTASLDAIFDWFDRRGYRAIDSPSLARASEGAAPRSEILWAYEPGSNPTR
jgi:DNA-binding transcriptional MerR regulator